jgi:hypothetical protein
MQEKTSPFSKRRPGKFRQARKDKYWRVRGELLASSSKALSSRQPRFVPRAEEPVPSQAEAISVSFAVERQLAAPCREEVRNVKSEV